MQYLYPKDGILHFKSDNIGGSQALCLDSPQDSTVGLVVVNHCVFAF